MNELIEKYKENLQWLNTFNSEHQQDAQGFLDMREAIAQNEIHATDVLPRSVFTPIFSWDAQWIIDANQGKRDSFGGMEYVHETLEFLELGKLVEFNGKLHPREAVASRDHSEFSDENLTLYNDAFAQLTGDDTWKQTRMTLRRALLHIVLDSEGTLHKGGPITVLSSWFNEEIMPLFRGFDPQRILNCLNEIRNIRHGARENEVTI